MLDPIPDRDATCPKCGALIYSRRSRLCGRCGTVLPFQMVLTDDQVKARDQERAWAHKLAGAFDPKRPSDVSTAGISLPRDEAHLLPENFVLPRNFELEFKRRKRPHEYLIFLGPAIFLMIIYSVSRSFGGLPSSAWVMVTLTFGLGCWRAWVCHWPVCPNCHQNIRTCTMACCYLCGHSLRDKRCSNCGADFSWTGRFKPVTRNYSGYIKHCPGCAAELNTWIERWNER